MFSDTHGLCIMWKKISLEGFAFVLW